ncbi:MAG: hypothetical protein RLZZ127_1174 [Planctomycetota bacterium]|jgi:putative peptidoglycan lipid II flippase
MPEAAAQPLWKRVATVSGWTLVSRVLGLVRDRLWAGAMGGSPMLDAFLAAFQLPNLFRQLFGEGALTAAVLPRYVQLRERDPAAAEAFLGQVLARMALWLSVVAGLGMAAAAAVMWCWPSWKTGMIATLVLPMLPYLVFICISAVLGAALNARRCFWVPAAAPVILNLALISTVWLDPEAEAAWLPYAVLAAGVLTVAFHLWAVRRIGGVPAPSLERGPELQAMGPQLGSSVFSSGVYQLGAFIDTQVAYLLIASPGAVAALFFANRLLQFPMALIGHGTSTASFPELAAAAARGWDASGAVLRQGAGFMAYWLVPAAVGLLVCAEPLVRTIYQTGAFGEDAVDRTVLVTRIMALGLIPVALAKFSLRLFQAHHDARTPMRVSLATVGCNIALTLILVWPLAEAGIALAGALAGMASYAAYVVLLRRRGAGTPVPWAALRRPLLAGVAMGAAVEGLFLAWQQPDGAGTGMAVLRLAAGVALGGLVYLPLAGLQGLRRRGGGSAATPPTA